MGVVPGLRVMYRRVLKTIFMSLVGFNLLGSVRFGLVFWSGR